VDRNIYLEGIFRRRKEKNVKATSITLTFLLIFGTFIGILDTVIAPPPPLHNIWGTANEGVLHPGGGVADGRKITAWIDGVTYGYNWTWDTGNYDLYVRGDYWGIPVDNAVKDGGWYGDMIYYFLDYDPMDYFLNVSHTTSSFSGDSQYVNPLFFNRTDQAPSLTTLRMLKINEIVLDPVDGLPQYVIVYDPGQNSGMNNITDYYLQKDNNVTHLPEGETFDFLTHANDIVDISNGYYYINLTTDLELNNSDELKLVWKSLYLPNDNPALTGPGNGTDIIVDRVEWGNYTNYINPVTPPDDRDYDNTTLLDFIDTASLYGTGASMIRTDDKSSSGYSGNGTDTDNCLADFKVLGECTPRSQQPSYPVHNIDSDEYFDAIQAAIDDSDTQDGHTITVATGIYPENVVVSKSLTLIGMNKSSTIIDADMNEQAMAIYAPWTNISGFTFTNVSNFNSAVIMNSADNSNISNCIITSGNFGIDVSSSINVSVYSNTVYGTFNRAIYIGASDWATVLQNNVSDNNNGGIRVVASGYASVECNILMNNGQRAIAISNSDNCTLENNTINTTFSWKGIGLYDSQYCTFKNNDMEKAGFYISGSFLRDWSTHDIDTTNTVAGRPIYYFKNQIGGTVQGDAGQVILGNATLLNVTGLDLYGVVHGIVLGFSDYNNITENVLNGSHITIHRSNDNTISGNRVENAGRAILLEFADYNIIFENHLENNDEGVRLHSSYNNSIYHNNFINIALSPSDNSNNTWNLSYPEGGNYWWNYGGGDNYKGPFQNIPGKDGIGDIPYLIIGGGSGAKDNYPLVEPYKPLENYTILKEGWNLISIPLIQEEQNLTRVLGSIDSWYDAVQWHDITDSSDPWKHHKVGKPFGNDLSHLNETMGFWIHITNPGDTIFLYNGTQPLVNQSIPLHPGWNMVGYPSFSNHNISVGLNNLTFDTHVDAIQWFDASTKTWHTLGLSSYFIPGRSYWVHSKVEASWEVPL
jgi:parallel beta-helix repeat protein